MKKVNTKSFSISVDDMIRQPGELEYQLPDRPYEVEKVFCKRFAASRVNKSEKK